MRVNPDKKRIIPGYLVEWLQHPLVRQRVRSIATVAVQQVNVKPTRLRELTIWFPADLDAQHQIVDALGAMDERIQREENELAKLRTLRQGLADDLLSGRVRVGDVA